MGFPANWTGVILRRAPGIKREVEDVVRRHVRHENVYTRRDFRPDVLEFRAPAAEPLSVSTLRSEMGAFQRSREGVTRALPKSGTASVIYGLLRRRGEIDGATQVACVATGPTVEPSKPRDVPCVKSSSRASRKSAGLQRSRSSPRGTWHYWDKGRGAERRWRHVNSALSTFPMWWRCRTTA